MLHAAIGKSKERGCIPYIWRSGRDIQPSEGSHSESTSRDAASETSVLAERAPLTNLLHRETGEPQVDRKKKKRLSSMRACRTHSYQVHCTVHARLSFLCAAAAVLGFCCCLVRCFLLIFQPAPSTRSVTAHPPPSQPPQEQRWLGRRPRSQPPQDLRHTKVTHHIYIHRWIT